jgi:hypothetical protein
MACRASKRVYFALLLLSVCAINCSAEEAAAVSLDHSPSEGQEMEAMDALPKSTWAQGVGEGLAADEEDDDDSGRRGSVKSKLKQSEQNKKPKKQTVKTLQPASPDRATKPSGTFPTEALKEKAGKIERRFLARKKVMADKRKAEWAKKVLQAKVDKLADQTLAAKDKKVQERLMKKKKMKVVRKLAYKAKLKAKKEKKEGRKFASRSMITGEKAEKAKVAVGKAVGVFESMRDAEGPNAKDDRKTTLAVLAKLRIARAHLDGSLPGLTSKQKNNPCLLALHRALTLATGDPTTRNVIDAKTQLEKSTHCQKYEKGRKIRKKQNQIRHAKERAAKKHREYLAKKKISDEIANKKSTEKKGKKGEKIAVTTFTIKNRVEVAKKAKGNEMRKKWRHKEDGVTKRFAYEKNSKTARIKQNEGKKKKEMGSKVGIYLKKCNHLAKVSKKAHEKREKAIRSVAYSKASLMQKREYLKDFKLGEQAESGTSELARGRPTWQSSTGWGGYASRAVDGRTNTHYGHRSCTHTHHQHRAWWRVDLQRYCGIQRVTVWNRGDCCGYRLNPFRVRVGNHGHPYHNAVCGPHHGSHCGQGRAKTVQCGYKWGRFVGIELVRNNYLTLCEVRAYGKDCNRHNCNKQCQERNAKRAAKQKKMNEANHKLTHAQRAHEQCEARLRHLRMATRL